MPNAGTAIAMARTMAIRAETATNLRYPLEKAVTGISTPLCRRDRRIWQAADVAGFPDRGRRAEFGASEARVLAVLI